MPPSSDPQPQHQPDPTPTPTVAGVAQHASQAEAPLARRALGLAAAVEPLSLLVLLANLFTVHLPSVAAAAGPVHGSAYLVGIGATWAGGHSRRARLLAWVPGVGALLASRDSPDAHARRPHREDSRLGHPGTQDSPPPLGRSPTRSKP